MNRWRAVLLWCLDMQCAVVAGVVMQAALHEFDRPRWVLVLGGTVSGWAVFYRLRWRR